MDVLAWRAAAVAAAASADAAVVAFRRTLLLRVLSLAQYTAANRIRCFDSGNRSIADVGRRIGQRLAAAEPASAAAAAAAAAGTVPASIVCAAKS